MKTIATEKTELEIRFDQELKKLEEIDAVLTDAEMDPDHVIMLRAMRLRLELLASGVTVEKVSKKAHKEVIAYLGAEGKAKTASLRSLAVHFVDLRLLVLDNYGFPSISGESFAYRTAIHNLMENTGIESKEQGLNILAALRYHISSRRKALGLAEKSHHDIAKESRLMLSTGPVTEVATAMTVMLNMSARLDDLGDVDTPSPEEALAIKQIANDIRRKARTISDRASRKAG